MDDLPKCGLTKRERDVWTMAQAGQTVEQIAAQLGASLVNVRCSLSKARKKQGLPPVVRPARRQATAVQRDPQDPRLSRREGQVMREMDFGLSATEAARALGLRLKWVRSLRASGLERTGRAVVSTKWRRGDDAETPAAAAARVARERAAGKRCERCHLTLPHYGDCGARPDPWQRRNSMMERAT